MRPGRLATFRIRLARISRWVGDAKYGLFTNDRALYYKMDAPLRTRLQAEWNKPHYAPLWLMALAAILLLGWIARRGFKARERRVALVPLSVPGTVRPRRGRDEMLNYLVRRYLYGLLVLLGVNLFTFMLFFTVNTPDDMARLNIGGKRVTQEQISEMGGRARLRQAALLEHGRRSAPRKRPTPCSGIDRSRSSR